MSGCVAGGSSRSNRKKPGSRSRRELSARERIDICMKIRAIKREVHKKYPGYSELFLKTTAGRAVRKEFPFFQRNAAIEKFLETERFARAAVVQNRLGRDITNPGRRSRAVHLCKTLRTGGHNPGAGFRRPGAGRKNKFLKIWERVKAWHSIERLRGETTDEQDT